MRVMIAGGGTGGHVIPALAIAGALKSAYAAEVCFIGTARGMETRLVPQAGYALELIDVGQLNRVSLATKLKTLIALPRGILHCLGLLRRWQPQVVVGVGGYASGPAMLAALILRVPTLAFEPNAVPGMANRLIGKRISAAAVNFAPTRAFFRNAEVTGIPVRTEFFALAPRPPQSAPRLLVMGGSQGARALNQKMPQIAKSLLDAVPGLTILHQAGARHAETTEAAYAAGGASADCWKVQAFLEDMPAQFAASDLILARSGASTVAELAASGKPSLLVPFPQAADDHQRKNAEVLVEGGAAVMLLEQEMTEASLLAALTGLLSDPGKLEAMATSARTFAHPQAAAQIGEMVAGLASSPSRL
jgi:UDP-N-acetylglucosamine--N-acetylmuramyl-(pentapeptide) pyrophosphoryl-undecaprenol N-acetylglucosamine transferase